MFYNVRTVLTSLQINHRRGLFVGKTPSCYWETVFTSVSEFDVFTFLYSRTLGILFVWPILCYKNCHLMRLPIISMLFFFAVISGVVCRVCRVFSYHSEININIQTWYIFLEFEKVNVVLVRTIELMYLVNRLKKRSKCPFYVYFVCLFCMYVPVDCKTTHYFVLWFAQCSWYLDY